MPCPKLARRLLALLVPLALLLAGGAAQATPVTASGLTVDVLATGSWSGGFNGAVRITDSSFAQPITSFSVVFKLAGSAGVTGTPWNGNLSAADASGNRTATNPSWLQYQPIHAGQTWDVGFGGTGTFTGATIVSVVVNGQSLSIGGSSDTTPPTVSLASSATSVTTASTITLTATASDNVGVARVDFYDGSTLLASKTAAPYTQAVALTSASNGTHAYTAKAYDAAGNVATSSAASVVVNIPPTDTTPPTVSLASSATSVTTASTITLTATATDNVGVAHVDFYDGATLLGSKTAAPYTQAVALTSASNGTHAFTARAYDAAANSATSTAVSVIVSIPASDTTPPTVSLASSATSITTASNVTLTATASDNVGVARVEFYDGTTLLSTDSTSPYQFVGAMTSANNGNHVFTARAYDAAGNSATSSGVSVVVNIPATDTTPPTVSLASSATSITTASNVTLTATAADNVGVARVEFYDGTALLSTDTTAPYQFVGAMTSANNGTHSFTAKAYDAAGNSATSTAVSVVVSISGGGGAPVYTSASGKFMKDGVELKLYGLNWFGMETTDHVLHGLWTGRQLDDFLSDFKSKGFNALRLPLSPQTINPGYAISSGPYSGNDCTAMCGKDGRTGLEYVLQRMQAAGMYALLDFHTCNPAQLGSGLPGSPVGCSGYGLSNWLADLQTMATLGKTYTNVIGIDLTNEPWNLTWSSWSSYASQGGQAVLATNPSLTVWVEGVGNLSPSGVSGGANWGQNLYEAAAVSGVPTTKLVFTPHSYGPSVAAMSYFTDPTFPANMPAIWDTLFGHLVGQGYTEIVGEFGGQYTGTDKTWQDAFVTYLINKGTKSSFYWCVNPNSGDTGGVLQGDWKTWNTDKLALLQRLMQ